MNVWNIYFFPKMKAFCPNSYIYALDILHIRSPHRCMNNYGIFWKLDIKMPQSNGQNDDT